MTACNGPSKNCDGTPIDKLRLTLRALAERPQYDTANAAYEHAADIVAQFSQPIDNGDGTVTFPCVPVTVKADAVEDGSTVIFVRPPKKGERMIHAMTGHVMEAAVEFCKHETCVILSTPPEPQFRAGRYYRTRGGEVVGPLKMSMRADDVWPLSANGLNWALSGAGAFTGDLLPGEVTVWEKPPASLPQGEYKIDASGMVVIGTYEFLSKHFLQVCYSDWTDPPKRGRYRVPGGGKVATWEGDA